MNEKKKSRVGWESIPVYEKGKLAKPLIDIDYMDERGKTWRRKWGAQSDLGRLRTVIVHIPRPALYP